MVQQVFLQDWTEVEEETYQELVNELAVNERIFIVADVVPHAQPAQLAQPGMHGIVQSCQSFVL